MRKQEIVNTLEKLFFAFNLETDRVDVGELESTGNEDEFETKILTSHQELEPFVEAIGSAIDILKMQLEDELLEPYDLPSTHNVPRETLNKLAQTTLNSED